MIDLASTPSRTVTAFFDEESEAAAARQALLDAGFSDTNIHLTPGRQNHDDEVEDNEQNEHGGFMAALGRFFMGDDDRRTYAEGLNRGGYLIIVDNLDASLHDTAVDILDREGTVDIDERAEAWRASGWSSDNITSGNPAEQVSSRQVASPVRPSADVIPIVDEQLLVGKRDVNLGRVRVRSYLQETPVSEQINLRDERVTLERRPVDRPLTAGEGDAFAERSIEAEEHTEQAVVSKQARVVEEVSLQKDVAERTETVSETVRHTEVEIDDERERGTAVTGNVPPKH